MTALLMITDGRDDCLRATIKSALAHLPWFSFDRRLLVDDSGNPDHPNSLRDLIEAAAIDVIAPLDGAKRGFGGAIQAGWDAVNTGTSGGFVFHLEDDFTFNRRVPLDDMISVLNARPNLVQLALRRQPWNEQERAAGGIVEMHPHDWTDCTDTAGRAWLESRRNFTTNPCLYRSALCRRGWPNVEHSEGIFTHQLLADPDVRFGYWGSRDSGEWVTHIGHTRVGTGY